MPNRADIAAAGTRVWLLALLALAPAAEAGGLFEEDATLTVEFAGPVNTLVDDRVERNRFPFTMTVNGIETDVELRVRGKSRARVCEFPPLRLYLGSEQPDDHPFAGYGKLKLVTHCKDSDRAEQDLLEEYAAYRMFSILTDTSYRVRLLRIRYTDTARNERTLERFGFLLEPLDNVAMRIGGEVMDTTQVARGAIANEHAATVYVYQYLIGNTDWSLVLADDDDRCCHNIELIDVDGQVFIVPYDFDLSGLVNARYARPDPSLRIDNVTTRKYRGYCTPVSSLRTALATITTRQEALLDIVAQLPGASDKMTRKRLGYLERFFKKAARPERTVEAFHRRCI